MDRELEIIHGEMEGTRKSLADKLGEVESLIHDKVQEAGDSVTSIVDGVKEFGSSVSESVTSAKETLKETFNLRKQIEDHPWAAVGAAVAAGVAGGMFLGRSSRLVPPASTGAPSYSPPASPSSAHKSEPGVVSTLLQNLQGLAVGSLMSVAQDLITQSAPPAWKEHLTGMVDDLCVQLTGEKPAHFVDKSAEPQAPQPEEKREAEPVSAWRGPANPVHNGGARF